MTTQEQSITHIWTRFNTRWLISGALAGVLAGTVMIAIASFFATKTFGEWSQSFKLIGTIFYGGASTNYGPLGTGGKAGMLLHYGLSLIYGLTFTQLVNEKSRPLSLVILGGVTSFIIWVFGCMLFLPSLSYQFRVAVSTSTFLYLHLLFGISFGIFLSILKPRE